MLVLVLVLVLVLLILVLVLVLVLERLLLWLLLVVLLLLLLLLNTFLLLFMISSIKGRRSHVETLVNDRGNGLDLCPELLFNLVKIKSIFIRDQVDRQTQVTETTATTDTMKIGLGILGEIKIDNHIHSLDIDTTRQKVGAHQVAANSISKVVEHSVTVRLQHLGMRVEARVSEFRDLLSQQFNTVSRVAENDGLVDLKLFTMSMESIHKHNISEAERTQTCQLTIKE